MENNEIRNYDYERYVSQPVQLSFFEENYILEPDDCNYDNDYNENDNPGYFDESYGENYVFD